MSAGAFVLDCSMAKVGSFRSSSIFLAWAAAVGATRRYPNRQLPRTPNILHTCDFQATRKRSFMQAPPVFSRTIITLEDGLLILTKCIRCGQAKDRLF